MAPVGAPTARQISQTTAQAGCPPIGDWIPIASDVIDVEHPNTPVEFADQQAAATTGLPAGDGAGGNTAGAARKRRRRTERPAKPLTAKQLEVVQLYSELKGDFKAVADRMGIKRQTAQNHYGRAMKKLGKSVMPKPKTQSIPSDRRGQETVAGPEN